MRFLEHAGLSRLSVLLKDLDVGDRVLSGRLELFNTSFHGLELAKRPKLSKGHSEDPPPQPSHSTHSAQPHSESHSSQSSSDSHSCQSAATDAAISEEQKQSSEKTVEEVACVEVEPLPVLHVKPALHAKPGLKTPAPPVGLENKDLKSGKRASATSSDCLSAPSNPGKRRRSSSVSSLLGLQTPAEARKLLVQLVTTMNSCFPDYDFSSVTPEAFHRIEDFVSVYSSINYYLAFIVERIIPGFLQDLWIAIKDAVDLRDVVVYTYKAATTDPFQDDDSCLFSFDYFFVDEKAHRILFFSCMTKKKQMESASDDDSKRDSDAAGSSGSGEDFADSADDDLLEGEIRY